jgi:ABC-2 type transport system permease protein
VTGGAPSSEVSRTTPIVRATIAQAVMELKLLVRSAESLLVTLGIPLGVLVFFSVVDVLPTGEQEPVTFLVPGVLAISVVATGLVAVAIQTAFERKYAVLKRLGGTPLTRGAFLVAKGLSVAALLLVQTILVLLVATVGLGWRPEGGLVLAALLVLLGAMTSTALGLLLAGTLRAEATLAASNALFLVLLVVSGVTFDATALPRPVATFGAFLPMGALQRGLATALGGDGLAVTETLVLVGWGLLAVAIGRCTFRWEP